jgi:DNA-3-methyladenine glycosylase I
MTTSRCEWVPVDDEVYLAYHNEEWGVPSHDDRHLFEIITLEGAQAGLSWRTILGRRDGYRRAFANFDAEIVSAYDGAKVDELVEDVGIIRHRGKIESTINNAGAVLTIQAEFGSLDSYVWGFVDGTPLVSRPQRLSDIPAQTDLSQALSKDLKRRGFRFVGPTTMYAFMQATGLVDDHAAACFRAK